MDGLKRFGPFLYGDLLRELIKLKQMTTIQELYNMFKDLPNMISSIHTSFLQTYFDSGLKIDIRR